MLMDVLGDGTHQIIHVIESATFQDDRANGRFLAAFWPDPSIVRDAGGVGR